MHVSSSLSTFMLVSSEVAGSLDCSVASANNYYRLLPEPTRRRGSEGKAVVMSVCVCVCSLDLHF